MKIGILWENFEIGGVTTHLENLLNNKAFKNFKFVVITNETNKASKILKKRLTNKNVEFNYYNSLNVIYFQNILIKIVFFLLRPFLFVISIFQFYFLLKKYKFNLLLAQCGGYGDFRSEISGLLAGKILNFPTKILVIHHSFTKPKLWNFLLRTIDIIIKNIIDGLIFVSKATRNNIYENTYLYSKEYKEEIIYNEVKIISNKKKNKKINKLIKRDKILNLSMLSRIEPEKGQELLIDVFKELPNDIKNLTRVYFIGEISKDYLKRLKKKLKSLNLDNHFIFTGYIHVESSTIIKKMDLLISLTRNFEGFGLSLAEALSVNTPVLATKVGGVTEFLNNKNSILINPNNRKELKLSLIKFVKNPKKYRKQSILGKKLIRKSFSSRKMSENYKNFFYKCMKKNKNLI